jgi:uroporphyrin-III C-methyltransferase
MSNAITSGKVWLVGAGPGDPDLLTLRAARLIMRARLIVHDGLVDPAILALARPDAVLVSVAKRRSRHTMPQDEINALLVREALAGKEVVRLKGGDPFIFGRGGEEAEACHAAGVPVEVVPGISAAIGAAAAAQMPLTHRRSASIVSFVAGQCKGLSEQDWSGLAGRGRTLVIYMGLATAEAIADKLIADGLAPDMPVAVVENATRPQMRVLRAPLAGLPDLVSRHKVKSPAVIVIGEVASFETVSQLAASIPPQDERSFADSVRPEERLSECEGSSRRILEERSK